MSEQPKFKIIDRAGMASVWINEWNVWDFNPKDLSRDVLSAIRMAYSLGVIHTKSAFQEFSGSVPDSFFGEEFKDFRKN